MVCLGKEGLNFSDRIFMESVVESKPIILFTDLFSSAFIIFIFSYIFKILFSFFIFFSTEEIIILLADNFSILFLFFSFFNASSREKTENKLLYIVFHMYNSKIQTERKSPPLWKIDDIHLILNEREIWIEEYKNFIEFTVSKSIWHSWILFSSRLYMYICIFYEYHNTNNIQPVINNFFFQLLITIL